MGGLRLYFLMAIAVLLSGLAALLPVAWLGAEALESSYREYAVRDMTANVNLFSLSAASALKEGDAGEFSRFLARAKQGSETRFTLIERTGRVIADSDERAERMENHLNRPEVKAALLGEVGTDIRRSPTLGTEWIYVAVPLGDDLVVRAAASLDEVNERLAQWWRVIFTGMAISLFVLLGLAFLAARLLSRPIELAAAGAEHFAKGDFSYRLPALGAAEMRRLSASLDQMARDLDERFKTIVRQREEMRAVFENMTEGVLAIDREARIMLLNRAAEKLLSVSGEMNGKEIESVLRIPDLLELIRQTSAAAAPLEKELRVPVSVLSEALIQAHSAPIRDDAGDGGVLVVLRDVTRLRQLETMRKDFVANVSHELRTPITAIQSSLEALLDAGEGCSGDSRQLLEMALKNARRLGAIIANLLLLAGMESGERKEVGTPVSAQVLPVIAEALSLCGDAAEARHVEFVTDCDASLTAIMNPRMIVHALVNLLDNAIKYGPEGGKVFISAQLDGKTAKIAVSDKGPGIPRRFQSRVFERFYRVDGSSRLREGSGLGLALVKHIALSQGGDVKLESDIGAGSTFILRLPHAHSENAGDPPTRLLS